MSQAAELTRWVKHREADLRQARLILTLIRKTDDSRTRSVYLTGLHKAIECVKIDDRMIAFETAQLNLCTCHASEIECTTIPPF